jgi:heme oxygenase
MILPFVQVEKGYPLDLGDGLQQLTDIRRRTYVRADLVDTMTDALDGTEPVPNLAIVTLADGTSFYAEGDTAQLAAMWQHATRYMNLTYTPKPAN